MRPGLFAIPLAFSFLLGPAWAGKEFVAAPDEAVVPNQWIVKFKKGVYGGPVVQSTGGLVINRRIRRSDALLVQLPAASAAAAKQALVNHPLVDYVEPNRLRQVSLAAPNDVYYTQQWALQTVGALQAWGLLPNRYREGNAPAGGRVKVAVLDTGADCTHPDFRNAGGNSTDSALGGQLSFALSQAPIVTKLASPACLWQDDQGHGTHVAGTIAASTNNATGVAGLAYDVELLIFKVLNASGSGDDVTISNAIMAAADAGARVISLSLGGTGYSQFIQDAVRYAWARDALVVAAAGNSGSNSLFFPAGAHYAMGVAATNSTNSRASWSNFGPSVDIAAPGVGIVSTYPTYPASSSTLNYASMSGTSMATPHVSALAGILAGTTPGVSAAAIRQRIQQSAQSSIANGGWDQYIGYGIMNAWRALSGTFRAATVGSVTGQVVDANGLPLSSVSLTLNGTTAITPTSGLFRFANLPAGTYSLTATASGFAPRTIQVTVVAGADTDAEIVLGAAGGVLTGVVSDAAGVVAGASVQALSGGLVQASSITDATGHYWMWVPPGTYEVRASAIGRPPAGVAGKVVAADSTVTVNLSLPAFGTVSGVVRGEDNAPIPGAAISLSGPVSAGATTDAAGLFTTVGLPSGTYQVSATAPGYATAQSLTVNVTAGTNATADFTFASAKVSISPATASLVAGQSRQFTATVTGMSNTAVTWSRTPEIGTLSASGLYTAPASISGTQTVTVTATSVEQPSKSASATVTLTGLSFSLSLSPSSAIGGVATTGNTIRLSGPAPPGGFTVNLRSLDPQLAKPPASVTVPEGLTTSPAFSITTSHVSTATTVTIEATSGAVSRTAVLSLKPVTLYSLTAASSLTGGASYQANRVTLDGPAPPTGAVVSLRSLNPDLAGVPASVTVPAGQSTSPNFTITTTHVSAKTLVTIEASYGGVSKTRVITLNPTVVSALSIATSVVGGNRTTSNAVYLNGPAPAGGAVVSLRSLNPEVVTVPASVTVPAGRTSVSGFAITTTYVSSPISVTVEANYGGVTRTDAIVVNPNTISSLSLSPSTVVGGGRSTGNRVRLLAPAPPGGAVVTLRSLNPSLVIPPATVTVAAGQTTSAAFPIDTTHVTSSTQVTIEASFGGVTRTGVLTLNPTALATLSLSPSTQVGGNSSTGNRITINGPAPPAGAVIVLRSANPALATVPASVTVAAGKNSAYFLVTTFHVATTTTVNIEASFGGVTKTVALTLNPTSITSLSLSPSTQAGGKSSTGNRIFISGPAPPAGAVVAVRSLNPSLATVPASVTIASGRNYAYFSVATAPVAATNSVVIEASYGGVTRSASLTINPAAP